MPKNCNSCGEVNSDTAEYCINCGKAINSDPNELSDNYCRYCGKQINIDAQFCEKCGRSIKPDYPNRTGFWESIEWKQVILGSVIGSIVGIIFIILMLFSGLIKDDVLDILFFLIITLSSGFYVGYIIGGDAKKNALNGALAGQIPSVVLIIIYFLYALFNSPQFFLSYILSGALILIILCGVFGALGGLMGQFINRKIKGNPKKIIVLGFILALVLLLFSVGYAAQVGLNSQPKHFDSFLVSFDYPGSWDEQETSFSEFGSSSYEIAEVGTDEVGVYVSRTFLPFGVTFDSYANEYKSILNAGNFRLISSRPINLNGIKGYEYTYEDQSTAYTGKVVLLDKYPNVYEILCLAPVYKYDQEQENFNQVLNSFRIK